MMLLWFIGSSSLAVAGYRCPNVSLLHNDLGGFAIGLPRSHFSTIIEEVVHAKLSLSGRHKAVPTPLFLLYPTSTETGRRLKAK